MSEKKLRQRSSFFEHPYKVNFGASIPEITERRNADEVFMPYYTTHSLELVSSFEQTERGDAGFGSTGR